MMTNLARTGSAVVFLSALAVAAPSAAAEVKYRLTVMPMVNGILAVETQATPAGRIVIVTDRSGNRHRLRAADGGFALAIGAPAPPVRLRRPDMLPDGVVARGRGSLTRAWLFGPTRRYPHGILGDTIEAGGLRAERADGSIVELKLGPESVFEDRLARFADLDGDGEDEILVIRSYLDAGSALTAVKLAGDKLIIAGEAEPIGRPSRWLNPAGTGDFDGDGKIETAVVLTPHIGGTLALYSLEAGKLKKKYAQFGFSNHAIGARELGLSAVLDANGDGIPDLAVPDARRRNLKIVSFAGGKFAELARVRARAGFSTAIIAADIDGDGRPEIIFGQADSTLSIVKFER